MSKSADSPQGTVLVLDPPEVIERKFKRAVTDSGTEVVYDPEHQPGVSNLLVDPGRGHGPRPGRRGRRLHAVRPAEGRHAARPSSSCCGRSRRATPSCQADPAELARLLAVGADKARAVASKTLARAQRRHRPPAAGLTPSRLSPLALAARVSLSMVVQRPRTSVTAMGLHASSAAGRRARASAGASGVPPTRATVTGSLPAVRSSSAPIGSWRA